MSSIESEITKPSATGDQKYFDLLEFAPDAFFQGDPQGNFILVNSKAISLTGYSREELLRMNMRNLFSDADLNLKPLRYDLLDKGETVIIEREILTKSNQRKRIEMSSKKNADGTYQSFVRDISEKIENQKQYNEIKQRYTLAFQTSTDSVTINDIDGNYVEVNRGFCEQTGFTRDEIIGKNSVELGIWVNAEDRHQMVELLEKEGVVRNFEANFRKKDGSTLVALMTANLVNIHDQPHVLAVTKVITQQKIIEQELRIAKEKAEENDRLKSAFLANISHEIRTPMNAILGFSELLRFSDYDEDSRTEFIDAIHSSGQHLLSLINDIVEISKIETTEITPTVELTDISQLLEEVRKQVILPEAVEKNLSIQFQNSPLKVHTDPTKLRQILLNLISNAIKFTDSGKITITYERVSGNNISFSVSDTGIGIPEEYQDLVFDRFRQVPIDRNIQRRGSGLGLSITKAYVELLGGWIGLSSVPGEGSTFHFTIKDFNFTQAPVQESIDSRSDVKASGEAHHKTSNFKILVVEDDDVNYRLLQRLLENWGFDHERAINGQQAAQMGVHERFQLILMDIALPKMSGIDALKQIRKHRRDVPIIAQTAHALQEEIDNFAAAGFDGYVTKPIDHRELLRKIRCNM